MTEPDLQPEPLTFIDGAVIHKDYVYFLAKYDSIDPDEYDCTLGVFYYVDEWVSHEDMHYNAISTCYYKLGPKIPGALVALSEQGDVHYIDNVGERHEKIRDAGLHPPGHLGMMSQVCQIGRSLYACGAHGQVYRRLETGWVHIDDQILDPGMDQPLTLNAIAGSAEDDIFVAGYHGRILHFDGRDWDELDSPTNLHLERICVVGRGEAYVCGNEGTLLWIHGAGITDLSIDTEEHFWGMTSFDGHLYVATLSTMYVLEDGDLYELDTGLGEGVEFYRLDSRDGMLWSIAPKDLVRFDGETWERVPFLDNEM